MCLILWFSLPFGSIEASEVLDSGLEDSARHVDCCDSWTAEWQDSHSASRLG